MQATLEKRNTFLDRPLVSLLTLNSEKALWLVILLLAIFSRFYLLGARVQSHDENSHVYYSWRFYEGQGFQHDPLMHGPLQFHLLAASYFMFGDNDFTARVPAALFSIAAVMFLWNYRRYLGRAGALVGGLLMLISPYMLFYGRYARNEAFIELFGVVMIWGILRYLETGQPRYLYIVTAANVLHFTSKETSFIYTAQALLFLGGYFIYHLSNTPWPRPADRNRFLLAVMVALILLGAIGGYMLITGKPDAVVPQPPTGAAEAPSTPAPIQLSPVVLALGVLFGLVVAVGLYFLVRGYSLDGLRSNRAFGLMLVILTLVLPQLAAFPVRAAGWKIPVNAAEVQALTMTDIGHVALFLVPITLLTIVIGLAWNSREWLINAAIWYSLFTIFYTSTFTNGAGFFTGLVGSLGYWLEQQAVERGNQPWYYYGLIQVPVYEFLPMFGTWLAFGIAVASGLRSWLRPQAAMDDEVVEENTALEPPVYLTDAAPEAALPIARTASDYSVADDLSDDDWEQMQILLEPQSVEAGPSPVFAMLGFWAVTSLLAYSWAGEKMPWLTVHITMGAILAAAWALGRLIDSTDWGLLRRENGWLALPLLPVFLISALMMFGTLFGQNPPFSGKTLDQLQATSTFLLDLVATAVSGAALIYFIRRWPAGQIARIGTLAFFALLTGLTARTTIQANYYNYDNANELLVYAHSAPGVKTALAQIEEISRRTTDGLGIAVAYDNETSYPYWWYLRNYPNANYYGTTPSRALRDKPVILVGDANFGKIEPVVANQYERFDYIRLWWPNQDYYDLTWERIRNALTNPQMRSALFEIWLNRDYTLYGQATGRDMSLPNWSPAARMRLYIRKDIAAKLWNYGSVPETGETVSTDPFDGKIQTLQAVQVIGAPGAEPGQFQRPRDMAVGADGSLYVVDSDNHRIQHLSPGGEVLQIWGSFGDVAQGPAEGGKFNQPWGIGIVPDGSVYVADTWNHRVQKFTSDGQLVTMWGYFGQAEQPQAFWGPRDIVVDTSGRVFVTDTGNKRVAVFDSQGNFLTQFGEGGMGPGQFDEPVGLGIDADGLIYVADTWNQRIQVFQESEDGRFLPFRQWDVPAWYGQSLDNKPFIGVGMVNTRTMVFLADPEGYRVLQYTNSGEPVRAWGDYGASLDMFGMPSSVTVSQNGIWVVDAGNSRIMLFALPAE